MENKDQFLKDSIANIKPLKNKESTRNIVMANKVIREAFAFKCVPTEAKRLELRKKRK